MLGAEGRCSNKNLAVREAYPEPGIIPPIRIPDTPSTPPIAPIRPPGQPALPGRPPVHPGTPVITPVINPIKVPDAPPNGPVCKRNPVGSCSDVTDFDASTWADVNTFRTKGADSQSALEKKQEALRNNDPNAKDATVTPPLSDRYKGQNSGGEEPYWGVDEDNIDDFWLTKNLPGANYKDIYNQDWRTDDIRNKDAKETGPEAADNIILKTHEHPESGIMIIKESRKEKDTEESGAKWTDMVMDNWVQACKDKETDPSDLKFMIRDNIHFDADVNKGRREDMDKKVSAAKTQLAIEHALQRINADGTVPRTFRSDPKVANNDELAGYQLIAGTAHGDRVLKMLTDYPQTMKNVQIESFTVFTPKTTDGKGKVSPGYHSIIINFHKKEPEPKKEG